MKKIKNLFLLFIAFFLFIPFVRGAGVGTPVSITRVTKGYRAGLHYTNPDKNNWTPPPLYSEEVEWHTYTTTIEGKKMSAFCIDSKASAPQGSNLGVQITEVININSSSSLATQVYHAGIRAILAKGYSLNQGSTTVGSSSISGNDFYVATVMALRNYTTGIFNDSKKGVASYTASVPSAHTNLAHEWYSSLSAADQTSLKPYQKISATKKQSWYREEAEFFLPKAGAGKASDILAVAKELFLSGLRMAAKTARKEVVIPTITVGANTSPVDSSKTYNEVIRVITLTPKDFDEDGVLKSIKLTYTNNPTISVVDTTYKVNGVTRSNLNNVELKDNPKIEIHIKARALTKTCDPLEYSLEYNYTDGLTNFDVYMIGATAAVTEYQRLIVSNYGAGGESKILTGTHKGSITACADGCKTEINIPKECTEIGEDAKEEWVESYIKGPEDVIKCVVGEKSVDSWTNKLDDAGNKYKASSCTNSLGSNNGMSQVANNSYCAVYCKEDYASIKFSGIKPVNSGRYFKIGAEIEGTKSCYTSRIDKEGFIDDMIRVQVGMIEAYNNYLKFSAAYNAFTPYSLSGGCCTKARDAYKSEVKFQGVAVNNINQTTGEVTSKPNPDEYRRVEEGQACSMICPNDDYNTTTWECNVKEVCDDDLRPGYNFKNDLANYRDKASKQMTTLKASYEKMIRDYKACSESGGWSTIFDFDLIEIEYDYEEDYMNMSTIRPQDKILEKVDGTLETSSDEFICNGDLADSDEGRYEVCGSTAAANVTRSFTTCTTSGCTKSTSDIPQARYVKRTVTTKSAYQTPRVFYNVVPSGNVVHITDADNPNYQTEVIDGLPVMIKTEVGAHKFKFDVKGVGEFYDACEGGRLIGSPDSVVKALEAESSEMNKYDFVGEYVCHYLVNCPNCDFICTTPDGGDCTWDIPPICKDPGCCPECIFTVENLQFYFRTISNKNISPTDRPLGFNWNYKYSVTDIKYGFITAKALETVKGEEIGKEGIDTIGDEIYAKDPILTVELTPEMATKVRKYNKTNESKGGYSNNSITCYDYEENGRTYKNLFCYSELLDELQQDYSNNIKFTPLRLKTPATRKNNNTQNGYWNVYTTGMPTIDENTIGGPSWR